MEVINKDEYGVPVFNWCPNIEDGAQTQVDHLAHQDTDFIKHVAVMSDAHLGFGMPIGGVIGCDRVVIPNAVGVN